MTDDTTDFGFSTVATAEKARRVGEVFSSVAGNYDLMNDLMSMGIHRLWKRQFMAAGNFRPGERVLDLAGGTGDIALAVATRVGNMGHVVLSDINAEMLSGGRDRVIDSAATSCISCAQINAEYLPFAAGSFDAVTIAFGLRNVTDKAKALADMYRVLQVGGRAMILEFSKVRSAALAKLYDLYSFQVLPRLGEVVAKDRAAYQYLAESIRRHPDQQTLASMMTEAGFARVSVSNLLNGMVAIHIGYRV